MFTLVYINGSLNRPDTLSSFLQSNVGKSPMLQIDCVSPYKGIEENLIKMVCDHLSSFDSQIEITYKLTQNISVETAVNNQQVNFLVMQVDIKQR